MTEVPRYARDDKACNGREPHPHACSNMKTFIAVALIGSIATEIGAQRGGRVSIQPPPAPKSLRAQPWPNDSSWRHIGPAAFGGRVDDIEAVESDPRTIFV